MQEGVCGEVAEVVVYLTVVSSRRGTAVGVMFRDYAWSWTSMHVRKLGMHATRTSSYKSPLPAIVCLDVGL